MTSFDKTITSFSKMMNWNLVPPKTLTPSSPDENSNSNSSNSENTKAKNLNMEAKNQNMILLESLELSLLGENGPGQPLTSSSKDNKSSKNQNLRICPRLKTGSVDGGFRKMSDDSEYGSRG
jgi:hypothetical protein